MYPSDFTCSKALTMVPRASRYCRARSRVAGSLSPGRSRPSRMATRKDSYSHRLADLPESRKGSTSSKEAVRFICIMVHHKSSKWILLIVHYSRKVGAEGVNDECLRNTGTRSRSVDGPLGKSDGVDSVVHRYDDSP